MIKNLSKPFKWFFQLEAASGLVLLIAAIIALVISNSSFSNLYFDTLSQYLFVGINDFGLKLSVHHWINDLLMAIFFFFVTLEIKREFIQGELSNLKKAMLPIIAAVGGMVVAVHLLLYFSQHCLEVCVHLGKPLFVPHGLLGVRALRRCVGFTGHV